jgi:hypothetical protein
MWLPQGTGAVLPNTKSSRQELLEELLTAVKLDLLTTKQMQSSPKGARYTLALQGAKMARRRMMTVLKELEKM